MTKVSPKNEREVEDEKMIVDCCCLVTRKPCSRRVILYNLKNTFTIIFAFFYLLFMIGSLSFEAFIYNNSDYSRDQQLSIIIINVLLMEVVVLPAIVISCYINKIIWPIIIFNIIFVALQMLLLFAVLVNVED